MAYSIRGLFAVSGLVALFMAAVFSRSDLMMTLTTMLFSFLILLGAALAFTGAEQPNFWRGFAVVALGTIFLSPQLEIDNQLASLLVQKLLTPVSVQLAPVYPTPTLPPSISSPYFTPTVVPVNASPYTQPVSVFAPASPGIYLPYAGHHIELIQKLTTISLALAFGLCGGLIINWIMRRSALRESVITQNVNT